MIPDCLLLERNGSHLDRIESPSIGLRVILVPFLTSLGF